MHYLYRYPKTEKEMRTQLMKKQYFLDEIDQAMLVLKAKKYIDDRQFAELYLNSEVVKKGKPLALMQQKLLFK
jgi:SOS response regulatory protein OraA/RecX